MLEFFRKNISNQFIRICRIQYNSKLRNQNSYPDHHYKLTFSFDGIGNPIKVSNLIERVADIYIYSGTVLLFTNDNNIYLKKDTTENNSYIDIGYSLLGEYSTNIKVKVETVNEGSVKFYCDEATQSEYTRQLYFGATPIETSMLYKGYISSWLAGNTNTNINITNNRPLRVTDMISGQVAYMLYDGTLYNADNQAFTISITNNGTYNRMINLVTKAHCSILFETF